MARIYHSYGNGRVDVVPFKLKDFNEMTKTCLIRRDKALKGSYDYMRWYRNYIILILGVNTGCRIETLLQLTPKHIAGGQVRIQEYKTDKIQRYELNDSLYKVVEEYINWLDIDEKEYIFRTHKRVNKPMTRENAYKIIKELADSVGIKYPVGCHSLRKSYGRFNYDDKNSDAYHDIFKIQKMLGHSNPLITQAYICLEDENVRKARKKSAYGI